MFLREITDSGKRLLRGAADKVSTMTTTSPRGAPNCVRPDGSPVRVLVVDDELSITELLSMALRYEGWQIRSAGDGQGPSGRPASSGPTPSCST
ncbi:hypothetical protein GCM10017687_83520 [Streptomyces echinatus]